MSTLLLGVALGATPCLQVDGPAGPMERFRGEPDSPALRDARARLPPDMLAMAEAEAHAATYVECVYRVRVGADRYTVRWSWDTTLDDKPDGWCAAATPTVQAQLLAFTRGCTDLQGGGWWGHPLVAAPTPPPTAPPEPEPADAPAPPD